MTDDGVDGVGHAAGRLDDNGVVGGVLTSTVGERGDESHNVSPRHIIMEWVAFGGGLAVAKVPFVALARLRGQPCAFGISGDDALVEKLVAGQTGRGVGYVTQETCTGIAESGNGLHQQTAGVARSPFGSHIATVDAAVGHREGPRCGEGGVGGVLAVPSIGETDGGGEFIIEAVATVGGQHHFVGTVEGEIGIAEMSVVVTVVGGQFHMDSLSVQRCQVDSHRCPVFPQGAAAVIVPSHVFARYEVGRIATRIDGVHVVIQDVELESGLVFGIVPRVLKYRGIA